MSRPNVTAIDLCDIEETLDSEPVSTDSTDTSPRLSLSVGREWEWSTDAEDARLEMV